MRRYTHLAYGLSLLLVLLTISVLTVNIYPTVIRDVLWVSLSLLACLGGVAYYLRQKNESPGKDIPTPKLDFDTLFQHSSAGIALLSLDGYVVKANDAIRTLFGLDNEDLQHLYYLALLTEEDARLTKTKMRELLLQKRDYDELECHTYKRNGEEIWVRCVLAVIRDDHHKPSYFIVQLLDISLQKVAEQQLLHLAYHDALTGLANRHKLEQFISQSLASARRNQQQFGVLILDIDQFKTINDTKGHEVGDQLLQIIAERLRNTVRRTDMVARFGGDEFVILVSDVKKSESLGIIAQKILASVMRVAVIKGEEIYVTTSIGISMFPFDGQTMQALVKNADLALYRVKEQGRNNYQFYTAEMTSRARAKMDLQNALGHAYVKQEFNICYQPKMMVETRLITGLEALLRWQTREQIPPNEIVQLAEETGLIIPISQWIIATAFKQLKSWHEAGYTQLTIALNCSSRQFKNGGFVDDIRDMLDHAKLDPSAVEIEITEGLIMSDPDTVVRMLYAFKDMGVKIAIDDFGTGYWSLGNLRKMSVDKIKIDRSYIEQIGKDDSSAVIISAIIAMAKKLGITSIAEGVETREQYDYLLHEGCTEVQGYLISKPLYAPQMDEFLSTKHAFCKTRVDGETSSSK